MAINNITIILFLEGLNHTSVVFGTQQKMAGF